MVTIRTDGCRVCDCADATPWAQENGFSAVKCKSCNLIYLSPWPDLSDRDRALQHGEHAGDRTLRTNTRPGGAAMMRQYKRVLDDLYGTSLTGSRVQWLDIGCGYGEFLMALQDRVASDSVLAGSEPNERKAAYASKRGLDVSFKDLDGLSGGYTHISLLNVFSHLPEPNKVLSQARDLLCEGGEMVVQTGNAGDIDRNDYPGILWLPDHLIFAGRNTLDVLCEKLGMRILEVEAYREPSLTPMNIVKDLAKRVLRPDHNGVKWRGPFRSLWIRAAKN